MLTGENGLLTKVDTARTENKKGEEKEQIGLAYTSLRADKLKDGDTSAIAAGDLKTELDANGADVKSVTGTGTLTIEFNSGNKYTIDSNGTIEYAGAIEETNEQLTIVADNDNDGVLSIGDEVAPTIDSIKNEHFLVLSVGESVGLVTKLAVDYVTNSQSSTAPYVTYDMAYCNKDGETETFIMPTTAVKETIYPDASVDEFGNPLPVEPIYVYYDGTETGQVHCTGTYTKAYRDRLVTAGLELNAISNSRLC